MFGTPNLSPKKRFPISGWLLLPLLGLIVAVLVLGQNSLWMTPVTTEAPAAATLNPSAATESQVDDDDVAPTTTDTSAGLTGETASADEPFLPEYDSAFDAALSPEADNRPLWQISLDLALKLVIVIGLAYASMIGLRWLQKTKGLPKAGSETIQILETVGLSPGKTLHLVVVGEKTLLLGATDHQLSLLSELSPVAASTPVTEEMLRAEEEPMPYDNVAATPFELAMYQQTMAQQQSPNQNETPPAAGEWQTVLESMKTGVRHIQEMVGGGQAK